MSALQQQQLPQETHEIKKQSYQNTQAEEATERHFFEKNTILNLKLLHEYFPKVNPYWDIQLLNNVIVMKLKVMTSNNSHAYFQVLTICEDENTRLHDVILSNLEDKIVENIKNTNAEIMKDVHYKQIDHTGDSVWS